MKISNIFFVLFIVGKSLLRRETLGMLLRFTKLLLCQLSYAAPNHTQPWESCGMSKILYLNFLQKSRKIKICQAKRKKPLQQQQSKNEHISDV